MKLSFILIFALALNGKAIAQQAPRQSQQSVALHAKAVKLIEVSGVRDRVLALLPDMIEHAKETMQKQYSNYEPAFFTEWGRRMIARFDVDEVVNIAVHAYEQRFTNDELTELISSTSSQKAGKPVSLSPVLQKKLTDLLPAIMGDITGKCTELGARLGGQVGAEIGKDHPEYLRNSKVTNP